MTVISRTAQRRIWVSNEEKLPWGLQQVIYFCAMVQRESIF